MRPGKIAWILLPLLSLSLAQCAGFYSVFRQESRFFAPEDKKILKAAAAAVQFDYGYDADMDLDYVFTYSYASVNKENRAKELDKSLAAVEPAKVVSFYEKLYSLRVKTDFVKERFRDKKQWNNYTYIEKYYLPPLNDFLSMMEAQVARKDKSYAASLEERKNLIKEGTEDEILKKDMDTFWQERFYYLDY